MSGTRHVTAVTPHAELATTASRTSCATGKAAGAGSRARPRGATAAPSRECFEGACGDRQSTPKKIALEFVSPDGVRDAVIYEVLQLPLVSCGVEIERETIMFREFGTRSADLGRQALVNTNVSINH